MLYFAEASVKMSISYFLKKIEMKSIETTIFRKRIKKYWKNTQKHHKIMSNTLTLGIKVL
ncbi:hypothetical protein CS009_06300 [Streptococcus macedonicus]|uniref:Uncharacterized protein n=2 Tax=Streptococcus TaxID=1301 RepID=A0AAP8FXK1_STRMC|nr:hypothetical protein AU077_01705 [Streptococcus gallolyticus]PHV57081.1 hypothetical protein CS009_06300 [Streptococcus macedonicus]CCF02991.1 Hypothetical protein SMA_1700 [Streptococcus macedonicus ACA-DC 198]PHV60439.1 hypothetical protein CS005_02505 [Streptococcus macedonicus]SCA90320.1 hypothetical protein SMA679_1759 [Streptococcus macedonicus]